MGFKALLKALAVPVTVPVKLIKKGKDKAMQAAIMGVIRHILTAGGGYFIGHGLLTGDQTTDAIGALMTLVGVVWSIANKRQKK